MLVKVENSNFVRDTNSMALMNINSAEKNEYISKVRMMNTQKQEINTVKQEMENIKCDVAEIKSLLMKLLESSNVQ